LSCCAKPPAASRVTSCAASPATAASTCRRAGRRVKAVRSWGKHFLLEFSHHTLRIHLMMFGSWRIDERKPAPARVSLHSTTGN
jgi:formamidopyrimidine-DNA glycosylase